MIGDFGLAKLLTDDLGRSPAGDRTQPSAVLGTPNYMAPKQVRASRQPLTPAVDVYALGAILYELLTGRPPFHAHFPVDVLVQVLHDEPVSVTRLRPTVPRALATITMKCLENDPRRRCPSARALAEDLRRYPIACDSRPDPS